MNRKIIKYLLNNYSLDIIEKSLIQIFLEEHKIKKINEFLANFLRDVNENEIKKIKEHLIKEKIELDLKTLIRLFELLIEPEFRKLNGAFYTPYFIVDYINKKVIISKEDIKVCDPSCGSGIFLVDAAEKISKTLKRPIISVIENNIYGVDIDPRSVKRTKLILSLLALINGEYKEKINFNIKVGDSLDPRSFNWREEFKEIFDTKNGFDGIVGNPPYVRIQNLRNEIRERIQKGWYTASSGNIDLYIVFFELGFKLLNETGKLGYITPNSYFSSFAGKKLRIFLTDKKIIKEIVDFNHIQIFEDVTTYTCITILDKKPKEEFNYLIIDNKDELKNLSNLQFKKIKYNILNNDKWILLDKKEFELIRKIETIGTPLKRLVRISVGLATLADRLYILENLKEKDGYYIKKYKGELYCIEKEITKEIIKTSIIKTEEDIEKNKRRIIFPYKKTNREYIIIPEEELRKKYPQCYNYFLAIKEELAKRDKGRKKYVTWYAYGRTQGIGTNFGEKILTPTMSLKPTFVICKKEDATFYAGYGIFYKGDLEILKKVLNSKIMKFYINKTSKVYRGGYRSYAKTFIQNFSIPNFNKDELEFLKKEEDNSKIDTFLIKKYFGTPLDI